MVLYVHHSHLAFRHNTLIRKTQVSCSPLQINSFGEFAPACQNNRYKEHKSPSTMTRPQYLGFAFGCVCLREFPLHHRRSPSTFTIILGQRHFCLQRQIFGNDKVESRELSKQTGLLQEFQGVFKWWMIKNFLFSNENCDFLLNL